MAESEAREGQDRTEEVSMRKVVVSEFVSLDGVMEDPGWSFQFGSEEQERFKFDELSASDALLLGRVTYEGFAAAWPNMMEQYEGPRRAELGEYADMMNGYPKHVRARRRAGARPGPLTASALRRSVGEYDHTRTERLRVDEFHNQVVAIPPCWLFCRPTSCLG